MEGRYMKYERKNHQARECKAREREKTPPFVDNTNQEPVDKKRKFDKRDIKFKDLGLEQEQENQ